MSTPANPYDATSKAHGLFGAVWQNLKVFGHDGNHYAYNIVNPLGRHFDNLNAFGDGTLRLFCDASLFFYGNSTITNLYGAVIHAGTADGIDLGGNGSGQGETIQLLEWHRPQIWLANIAGIVTGTTAPTKAQLLLNRIRHGPDACRGRSWLREQFSSTVKWPIEANKTVNGIQGGTQHSTNLAGPPRNVSSITSNTYYRNTQGCDILYLMSFHLNPDATNAATVNVKLSSDGVTDGPTVYNQTMPAGNPTQIPLTASFIIPAGYWFKLVTVKTSWNDFSFQKVQY